MVIAGSRSRQQRLLITPDGGQRPADPDYVHRGEITLDVIYYIRRYSESQLEANGGVNIAGRNVYKSSQFGRTNTLSVSRKFIKSKLLQDFVESLNIDSRINKNRTIRECFDIPVRFRAGRGSRLCRGISAGACGHNVRHNTRYILLLGPGFICTLALLVFLICFLAYGQSFPSPRAKLKTEPVFCTCTRTRNVFLGVRESSYHSLALPFSPSLSLSLSPSLSLSLSLIADVCKSCLRTC